MPLLLKKVLTIFQNIFTPRAFSLKLIGSEMRSRTIPTTLLQIFCEFMLNFKFILRNIMGLDGLTLMLVVANSANTK